MIQKLKRQFIGINMILVMLVIIPTFVYMQLNTKNDMAMDSYMAIEEGLNQFGNKRDDLGGIGINPEFKPKDFVLKDGEEPVTPPMLNENFFNTYFVTLDTELNILETHSRSNFVIDDEDINIIVNEIMTTGESRGILLDRDLRYVVKTYTTPEGVEETAIGFMDISYELNLLANQRDMFLMISFVILIIFFGISVFLANHIIKPIEKSWKQQQQFVSDVSHELKTPTAVILANTSILKMNPDLNDDKKWVDYIEIEAKRMKKLVEDLLFLSKSDYKKSEQVLSSFSLSDVVLNSTLPFEAILFESKKNVEIVTDITPDNIIIGDENQLKQLVNILLDNAFKYSLENSNINISLKQDTTKNNVILKVNNMSEVISEEDLEHLFDRFYKVDKARTRDGNSYGLGLSIAKEIVSNHKGKISVKSDAENGTTFKIVIPLQH